MKRLLAVAILLGMSLFSTGAGQGNAFAASTGTTISGPYPTLTPDFGSCNNNIWANDTLGSFYAVTANSDGSYAVTVTILGAFDSVAGTSPGACETNSPHGSYFRSGTRGSITGYYTGTIPGGTFDPNACKSQPKACDVFYGFIFVSFSEGMQYSCLLMNCQNDSEYFSLASGLKFRHWRNYASGPGPETLSGDIASH